MKVPGSVRDAYAQCCEWAVPLRDSVDNVLRTAKEQNWHYESRIKTLVSYALKLETGRVRDPLAMEDLFACTIVVPTHASVQIARALIASRFEVISTRPASADKTHKRPSAFDFDDLRMYVHLKADDTLPQRTYEKVPFEVQIKTFLQHAWGVSTHDLVYKGNRFSWALERVAFEIKAMLEHAEVSIARAEDLAESDILKLSTPEFEANQTVLTLLEKHWPDAGALPEDRVRLARTVAQLIARLRIDVNGLDGILSAETVAGRGTLTLDLSPYGILAESIFRQRPDLFNRLEPQKGQRDTDFCLFLPRELSGAAAIAKRAPKHVVRLT